MAISPNRSVGLIVSTLSLLTSVCAFADDELVGKQVIAIRPHLAVRRAPASDASPVGYSLVVPVRKVEDAKAGWLRVKEGWVRESDVAPVDQALRYFTSQINESPTAYAYAARSRIRRDTGEVDEAAKDAERALSLDPTSCDALYAKSLSLRKAGRVAEAVECYSSILSFDPRCRGIYFLYARTLMDKKDADGVLDVVSTGLRQWPDDIDLRRIRALWRMIRGSQRTTSKGKSKTPTFYDSPNPFVGQAN